MKLTQQTIKHAKPKAKPYRLSDGHGLYLEVKPTGAKYWRKAYKYNGKQKTLAIGVYPQVGLREARMATQRAKEQLAQGIDPSHAKQLAKHQQQQDRANTFEAVALEWLERTQGKLATTTTQTKLARMQRYLFPIIGKVPIQELRTRQLQELLQGIDGQGKHETASRLMQLAGAVCRYAIQTDRATTNPVDNLRGILQGHTPTHQHSLPYDQMSAFTQQLHNAGGHEVTRHALWFVLYTFVRSSELRHAQWQEIDTTTATWTIPAERMKMRRPHKVPLSRQALAILETMRPLTGHRLLIFASPINPRKPLSENTLSHALHRMGCKDVATVHGFRGTASSWFYDGGYRSEAIELQLSHQETNKVKAAYNYRAEYWAERVQMMQAWADFITP